MAAARAVGSAGSGTGGADVADSQSCGSFLAAPVTAPSPPSRSLAEGTGERTITLRWTHLDATAKFNISAGRVVRQPDTGARLAKRHGHSGG